MNEKETMVEAAVAAMTRWRWKKKKEMRKKRRRRRRVANRLAATNLK